MLQAQAQKAHGLKWDTRRESLREGGVVCYLWVLPAVRLRDD